ncbi:hypothetical protein BASA81_004777 [Batrachochytrium salamandrivorans]|nr:hypothetical protein BASA81_004777 [Batrachochytrium salamandrivorans]
MQALLDAFTCPLCCKHLVDPVTTVDCLHTFCSSCLDQYLFSTHRACPTCSRPQTPGITIKPHAAFNNLHAKSLALQRFLPDSFVPPPLGEEVVTTATMASLTVMGTQEIQREKEIVQKQLEVVERVEQHAQRVLGSSTLSFARKQQLQTRFGESCDMPTYFVTKATKNLTTGEWQCAPTFKYYWAISVGAKVVREEWLDSHDFLGDNEFQVKSTTCTFVEGPKLQLFAGQSFQLGPFSAEHTLQRTQAAMLIQLHGGTVVDLGGNADVLFQCLERFHPRACLGGKHLDYSVLGERQVGANGR